MGIVDPDGMVLQEAQELREDLIVADIETVPRAKRRGWDSYRNPTVVHQYIRTISVVE